MFWLQVKLARINFCYIVDEGEKKSVHTCGLVHKNELLNNI